MGYIRIGRVTGGAARLAMPTSNVGAIDKVTDGTREYCPIAERGQRSGKPPTPRAPQTKRKPPRGGVAVKERNIITLPRFAKQRKRPTVSLERQPEQADSC